MEGLAAVHPVGRGGGKRKKKRPFGLVVNKGWTDGIPRPAAVSTRKKPRSECNGAVGRAGGDHSVKPLAAAGKKEKKADPSATLVQR